MHFKARLLEAVNREALLAKAQDLRGVPCAFASDDVFVGSFTVVLPITFKDGVRWAARLPSDVCSDPEEMRSEAELLKYLAKRIDSPVRIPTLHHVDTDGGAVGTPYFLVDWIDGHPMRWDAQTPDNETRQKLLAEVARFVVHLLERTTEAYADSIFPIPVSTTHWLTERLRNRLRSNFLRDTLDVADAYVCLLMLSRIPRMVVPYYDDGPFPVMHPDLDQGNIILEESGQSISGIIDWGLGITRRVPLQIALRYPFFISYRSANSFDPQIIADRKLYVRCLKLAERTPSDAPSYSDIVNDEERSLFHEALFNRTALQHYRERYAQRNSQNNEEARAAYRRFLQDYPSLADIDCARLMWHEMNRDSPHE